MTIYRSIVTFRWSVQAPKHTQNREISGNCDGRHDIFKGHAAFCSPACFHGFIDKKVALVSDNKSADGSADDMPFGFHSISNVVMKFWSTHPPDPHRKLSSAQTIWHRLTKLGCQSRLRRKCSRIVLRNSTMRGSENRLGLNWRSWTVKLSFPKVKKRII